MILVYITLDNSNWSQKDINLALHILNNVVTRTDLRSEVECFNKIFKVEEVEFLIDFCLNILGY